MSLRGKPLCALYEVEYADLALFPEKQVVSTPASFNTALAHFADCRCSHQFVGLGIADYQLGVLPAKRLGVGYTCR